MIASNLENESINFPDENAKSLIRRVARSGQPTCTSGIEVFGVMDGSVDLVLDGGTVAGTGATTIDVTEVSWKVIKEGAIAEKEIAEVLNGS